MLFFFRLLESSRGDGDAPLLDTLDVQEFIEDGPGPGALKSSSLDSISNLTNCILGAGKKVFKSASALFFDQKRESG